MTSSENRPTGAFDSAAEKNDKSQNEGKGQHERRMYLRFGAMIATSTLVMFILTYSNTYDVGHIQYSQERLYMALLMGGAMALVMLSFMVSMMYKSRTLNAVVVVTALVVFGLAYTASRAQWFIDDELYMKGMIPHHSIAILTSERADIDDVRVRQLANQIIETQRIEIKEMEWLLQDIEENGLATTEEEAAERPIPDFEATIAGVDDTRQGPARALAGHGDRNLVTVTPTDGRNCKRHGEARNIGGTRLPHHPAGRLVSREG